VSHDTVTVEELRRDSALSGGVLDVRNDSFSRSHVAKDENGQDTHL